MAPTYETGMKINDTAPGIIVTPPALDEFNGPRGDFYKNMFAKCPAGRPGTADEVANAAELLMSGAIHRLAANRRMRWEALDTASSRTSASTLPSGPLTAR